MNQHSSLDKMTRDAMQLGAELEEQYHPFQERRSALNEQLGMLVILGTAASAGISVWAIVSFMQTVFR